ncbi:MAG: hypothetical protein N3D84_03440, partial [Candidatus Woesearchaeota archaeon]|nr:hypothetical protein [Candidatus Woesearchaeota archaeon]
AIVMGIYDNGLATSARYHHIRYDGNTNAEPIRSYPDDELSGEDIPLVARIITVADAFDAMISGRPYKPARSPELALKEIIEERGKQFCPNVADAFVEAYREGKVQPIYSKITN